MAMADRHHRKNGFGAPVSETASQFPTSLHHHTTHGKSNMSLYSSHADDGYSNANTRHQSRHATLKKANERLPPGPPMPPMMKMPSEVQVMQVERERGTPTKAEAKTVTNTNHAASTASSNLNPASPTNGQRIQRDSVHIRRANSSETRLPGSTMAPAIPATAAPASSNAVRKGVLKQSTSPGLPEKSGSPPLPQQQQQQQQTPSPPKQQQEEREPEGKIDESHKAAPLTAAQQPKSSSTSASSNQQPSPQLLIAPRPMQLATLDEEGLRSLSASPRPQPLPSSSGTRPSQVNSAASSSTSSSAAATAAVGITAAGVTIAARSISASASSTTAAAASASSSASGSGSAAAVAANTGASLSSNSSRSIAGTRTGTDGAGVSGAGSARFQPSFDTEFSIPPRLAMMNAVPRSAYSPRGAAVAALPLRLQTMHGVGMVAQASYQPTTIESFALVRAPLKLHPQNVAAQQAALLAQTLSPQPAPSIYSYSNAGIGVQPTGGGGLADDDQPFLLNRTQSEMMPNRRLDPSFQLGGGMVGGGGGGAGGMMMGGYTHANPPVSRVLRPMVAPDLPGNFYLPPGILNDAPPVASPMMGSIQARRDAKKKVEAASREAARRTVPTQHRRFLSGADQDKLVQGGSAFPALNPDDEMSEMCLDASPLTAAIAAAFSQVNSPEVKPVASSSSSSAASAAASVAVAAGSPAVAAVPGSGSTSGGSVGGLHARVSDGGPSDPSDEISPQFRVPSGAEMSLMTLESDFDLRREATATDSDKSNKNSPGHYAASSSAQKHRSVPQLQSAGLRTQPLQQQHTPPSPAAPAVPSSRAVGAAVAVAPTAAASSAAPLPSAVAVPAAVVRRNSFSVPKHLACMHVSLTDGAAPRSPGANPLSPSLSPRREEGDGSRDSSH